MNHRGFIHIFVAIVILGVIVVIGIILLSSSTRLDTKPITPNISEASPSPSTSTSLSPTPTTDKYGFSTPVLYPQLSWKEVSKANQKLSKSALRWKISGDNHYNDLELPGSEWMASKKIDSAKEAEDSFAQVQNYYQNLLYEMGWKPQDEPVVIINNYAFYGLSGGGASEIHDSYHKIIGNNLRIIRYSEETPTEDHSCGANVCYPYTRTYRLYASDVITKDNLLDLIE